VERNFRIEQSVVFIVARGEYDLHNGFNFEGVKVAPGGVLLSFHPDLTWGVGQPHVSIAFSRVKLLSFSEGFGTLTNLNDFEEAGYKEPTDQNLDYIEYADPSSSACHLVFRFGNDQVIRIWSDSAELMTEAVTS
jgi:hypothetical protein